MFGQGGNPKFQSPFPQNGKKAAKSAVAAVRHRSLESSGVTPKTQKKIVKSPAGSANTPSKGQKKKVSKSASFMANFFGMKKKKTTAVAKPAPSKPAEKKASPVEKRQLPNKVFKPSPKRQKTSGDSAASASIEGSSSGKPEKLIEAGLLGPAKGNKDAVEKAGGAQGPAKQCNDSKESDESSSEDDEEDWSSSSEESGLEDADSDEERDAVAGSLKVWENQDKERKSRELERRREEEKVLKEAERLLKEEAKRQAEADLIAVNDVVDDLANMVVLRSMKDTFESEPTLHEIGDKVLCWDMTGVPLDSVIAPQGLLYEACVLKIGNRKFFKGGESEPAYLVHFDGFSKKWDTYVPGARIFCKSNPKGRELQKAIEAILDDETKKVNEMVAHEQAERERVAAEAEANAPPAPAVLHEAAKARLQKTTFPLKVNDTVIYSLGSLQPLYATSRQLLPVGYKSTITFTSFQEPSKEVLYTQTTEPGLAGSQKPIFAVKAGDCDEIFRGQSPGSVWKLVLNRVASKMLSMGLATKRSLSGLKAYAISEPETTALLEGLPGALDASTYVFQEHRKFEAAGSANDSPCKKGGKQSGKQPPAVSKADALTIQKKLVENKKKLVSLQNAAEEHQRDAAQWRKRRVLKKFGATLEPSSDDGTAFKALLQKDEFQAALAKYVHGSRATMSYLVQGIMKALKMKKTKGARSVVCDTVQRISRRVHIGCKPAELEKSEHAEDESRSAHWVWILKKQEHLFYKEKVMKSEKYLFRDLSKKLSVLSRVMTQLQKLITLLADPYVTIDKAKKAEELVVNAEVARASEDFKREERLEKMRLEDASMRAEMEAKAAKRQEAERLRKEKKLARETEKAARRAERELMAQQRREDAEKAREEKARLAEEKMLRLEEEKKAELEKKKAQLKKKFQALGVVKSQQDTDNVSLGLSANDRIVLKEVLDDVIQSAFQSSLLCDVDHALSVAAAPKGGQASSDYAGVFLQKCQQLGDLYPQLNSRRWRLFQFSENQRPAYWGPWMRSSKVISKRNPFAHDKEELQYEMDSDEEWEDGQPAEDLEMSDGEEEDGADEVDNEMDYADGWLLGDDEVIYENGIAKRGDDSSTDDEQQATEDAQGDSENGKLTSKKRKFANFTEFGSELVIGTQYESSTGASDSQLFAYKIVALVAGPIDPVNQLSAQQRGSSNLLGFQKIGMSAEHALKKKEKAEKLLKRKRERMEELERKKLERAEKAERLKQERAEAEKRKTEEKLKKAAERARLVEAKKLAKEKLKRDKLAELKEKEIKHTHLRPFLEHFHGKGIKKQLALAPFFELFPKVSKANVDRLIKKICVKESRNFDRAKWYVQEFWFDKINTSPEEAMRLIKEGKQ
jgi:hypothetical protein